MATTGYSAALDSSGIRVAYAKETAYKTAPASAFKRIRLLSESLSSTKTRTRPAEIKSDGQASAALTTQVEASGDIGFGLSSGTYDDFFLGAINAESFSAEESITDISDATITAAGVLGSTLSDLSTLDVGSWVRVKGFDDSGNNGIFRISAAAANQLTLVGPKASGFTAFTPTKVTQTGTGLGITGTHKIVSTTDGFWDDFEVDEDILLTGLTGTNATKNGVYTITAKSTNGRDITLNGTPGPALNTANSTITIAKATDVDIVQGGRVRNGTAINTLYIEKELTPSSATNKLFLRYPGCYVSGASLDLSLGGFAEGSFTLLAAQEENATTTASTGAATEAPTGTIVDTISGVAQAGYNDDSFDDSSSYDTILQSLSFSLSKDGARTQYGIGSSDGRGIGPGTISIEGTVSVYFRNFTMYELFVEEHSHVLSFALTDSEGDGYVFSFPAVVLLNPSITAGGPDTDLVAEFTLEANPGRYQSSDSEFTIQIDKVT